MPDSEGAGLLLIAGAETQDGQGRIFTEHTICEICSCKISDFRTSSKV